MCTCVYAHMHVYTCIYKHTQTHTQTTHTNTATQDSKSSETPLALNMFTLSTLDLTRNSFILIKTVSARDVCVCMRVCARMHFVLTIVLHGIVVLVAVLPSKSDREADSFLSLVRKSLRNELRMCKICCMYMRFLALSRELKEKDEE